MVGFFCFFSNITLIDAPPGACEASYTEGGLDFWLIGPKRNGGSLIILAEVGSLTHPLKPYMDYMKGTQSMKASRMCL